jgi:hypothetical protein
MKEKEKILFSKWKEKRQKFVPDGIVDELKYNSSSKKVLYLLKEVNGGKNRNSNWDLRSFLKDGGRRQTWDNIAIWQFGINNLDHDFKWNELISNSKDESFRKIQLEGIAVINLKKEPGGHTANSKLIWDYSWKDREFIKEQISIYKPEIIICCGTGKLVQKHVLVEIFSKLQMSPYGIEFYITRDKSIIINYCHPEARIDDNFKFFPLIETLREIERNY